MTSNKDLSQVAHEQFAKKYPDRLITKSISLRVWEDKELLPSEILLEALIDGLSKQKGFCYAANKRLAAYLPAQCFKSSSTEKNRAESVSRWLEKLSQRGHIFVRRKKFGFVHWVRIYTAQNKYLMEEDEMVKDEDLKNVYDTVWNQYGGDPQPASVRPPTSLLTNLTNTKPSSSSDIGKPISSSEGCPPKKSYGKTGKINLTPKEYTQLSKVMLEERLKIYIQDVEDWLIKNKKPSLDDAKRISNWWKKDCREGKDILSKGKNTSKGRLNSNDPSKKGKRGNIPEKFQ